MPVPFQSLEAPPSPEYTAADISLKPWSGAAHETMEPGRELVHVPKDVADYIIREKQRADALAESGPLASIRKSVPELKAVAEAHRLQLAALNDEAARRPKDVTPAVAGALAAMDAPKYATVRTGLTDAMKTTVARLNEQLDAAERAYLNVLDDPLNRRSTPADVAEVANLLPSLQVLTVRHALPILRRALITEPVTNGKFGKSTALLPVLKSMYDSDSPRGYHCDQMRQLLREAEIVRIDAHQYAARRGLQSVARARFKLGLVVRDVLAGDGALDSPLSRTGFFKELGA